MATSTDILATALAAHDAGLCVIPPKQDGSKRPFGKWTDYQHRRPSRDQLIAWFDTPERTGVGIICGAISGNLEMLEWEGRARDQWKGFVARCNETGLKRVIDRITNGYAELTPSGGIHLLYRCPEIEGNRKLASRPATPDELAAKPEEKTKTLIETRGEGGFTIVAPSYGTVHDSGLPYEHRSGSFDTIATITPAERAALFALAEEFDTLPKAPVVEQPEVAPPLDEVHAFLNQPSGAGWIDDTIDEFNRTHTWTQILVGWHEHHTHDGITYWTRPGKEPRLGWSATTNSLGTDRLIVFSSAVPGFDTYTGSGKATSYDKFSAWAQLNHGGDRVNAARQLRPPEKPKATSTYEPIIDITVAPAPAADVAVEVPAGPQAIDWTAFWNREHVGEDWLIHPLLPRGRQVALWAKHKTGKSLLSLEVAAAIATGRACLDQPAGPPSSVVYIDLEMTEDDLHDRLEEMGYGPDHDLTHLHYYLLPSLPPLDSAEGGVAVVNIAVRHQAELVVIDTMARAVSGDENDADTYRDFYRYTGIHLKARGISMMRLDHGGKDDTKGQRGSSGKGDDVDVVWQLKQAQNGLILRRDAARMSWVPEQVALERLDKPLRHKVVTNLYPPGSGECAAVLERLGVPVDATNAKARQALKAAGESAANDVLAGALRWRRAETSRLLTDIVGGDENA